MRDFDETWLKKTLERDLRTVSAPDELWDRIQHPRVRRTHSVLALVTVLTAAAAVAVGAVWGFFPRPERSTQELAVAALDNAPAGLELQSGTFPQIRAWVKERTGIDLPLPQAPSRMVTMRGVCAVRGGTPGVEVAYRVSGHNAALVVSRAGPGMTGSVEHRFLKCDSTGAARVSSWTMHGQLYTLAYDARGDARDECLLCHVVGPLTLAN